MSSEVSERSIHKLNSRINDTYRNNYDNIFKRTMLAEFLKDDERTEDVKFNDNLIIISGLPRSGTSMMMRIFEQSGCKVIHDRSLYWADKHNPNGYYELRDISKIKDIEGTIKVASQHIRKIKSNNRIIHIERDFKEIMMSMESAYREQPNEVEWKKHIKRVKTYLKDRNVTYLNYNKILNNPKKELTKIKDLLSDFKEACHAVDSKLYRNKTYAKL